MMDSTQASEDRPPFAFDKRLSATLATIYDQNNVDHAVDIFEYYISSIEAFMRDLSDAFNQANLEAVSLSAHTLVATFGYVGLSGCIEKAEGIKDGLRRSDWAFVASQLTMLSDEIKVTFPIITSELQRLREYAGRR